ncbi:MAG: archease [Chloroflexi bacterium]|nr:archease [Chloroflexota bacterium]
MSDTPGEARINREQRSPATDGPTSPISHFDHAAGVGFVARGSDLREAFANAGVALFGALADLSNVEQMQGENLIIAADDTVGLLAEWLTELLYRYETDGLLFSSFDVHYLEGGELRAVVYGERADPARHELRAEVRGIAPDGLEVHDEPGAAWVQFVLAL